MNKSRERTDTAWRPRSLKRASFAEIGTASLKRERRTLRALRYDIKRGA